MGLGEFLGKVEVPFKCTCGNIYIMEIKHLLQRNMNEYFDWQNDKHETRTRITQQGLFSTY